jgi:hypothetical protein
MEPRPDPQSETQRRFRRPGAAVAGAAAAVVLMVVAAVVAVRGGDDDDRQAPPRADAPRKTSADAPTPTGAAPIDASSADAEVNKWTTAGLAPQAGAGEGAFRTLCGFSHLSSNDPILYPGQPGRGHLHTWFGNRSADAFSTHDSLRAEPDSTCQGGPLNGSAYWMPTVLNGDGQAVLPTGVNVYYKAEPVEGLDYVASTETIPPGLVMVAGSIFGVGDAHWYCSSDGATLFEGVPDSCPPSTGGEPLEVIAEVVFPRCWDGRLDAADHVSHVADQTLNDLGQNVCPPSHPRKLPIVTYKAHYQPEKADDISSWSLSSDEAHPELGRGGSLHGDWMGAWQQDIADQFVEFCIRPQANCDNGTFGPDGLTLGWPEDAGPEPWSFGKPSEVVPAP